jgi:hypothetical protein
MQIQNQFLLLLNPLQTEFLGGTTNNQAALGSCDPSFWEGR